MTTLHRSPEILRYTAFSADRAGGNPAGVVLDATGLSDGEQLAIAAQLGYSETAFLTAPPAELADQGRAYTVRYFSPKAEVSFCGHATIATAIAYAERHGPGELVLATPAGTVPVRVTETPDGTLQATLTSVEPAVHDVAERDVTEALTALGWHATDLDPAFPPRIGYAGARHLILAAATRSRLADLSYDFERLKDFMTSLDLTTVQLVWRESETVFHVRDPFPVGGVVEDPATGAAAAAFGAYARELGLVPEESNLVLHQGADMGRPGELWVELVASDLRVRVGGTGTRIPETDAAQLG
ncbi:PhzF family phenazine biosynthesis protein [Streptomyces sp. RPA4-5]|uniref:PhzF family phenazine biosynthesis protein n=1 Tax=Streptomyces TaxID=1883 RepID=UPI00143EA3CB|nr:MULTISPECIES: PhzF family phenazine biosynthesis isomerase [Streptomyces]MCX4637133.1 PhzF family phenazine biosynthesis protein [Streptomyces platensis]QIY54109.1 PhzF family phenazine biosynthesis protein [Streptomyces sp. RPA4-5]WJY36692.1 PhzF family phenazine biosynthesis isomerase [Streptomyces sp. P9-2B-2]